MFIGRRWRPGAGVLALLLVPTLALPSAGRAQVSGGACGDLWGVPVAAVGDRGSELHRLLEVSGRIPVRSRAWTTVLREAADTLCSPVLGVRARHASDVAFGLAPVQVVSSLNTARPVGGNDGALWAAKGLSGGVSGGIEGRRGRFSYALRPTIAWGENRRFEIYDTTRTDRSEYAYPWHAGRIDWPQRHGEGAFLWVLPGESYVRADLGPVELSTSTESVRWGPAQAYPLLLSANAPGFAHVAIQSRRPWMLGGFAAVEVQVLWGVLEESDYFDYDEDNDRRLLSGLVLSVQPSVLPGFYLGIASLAHRSLEGGFDAGDLLAFAQVPVESVGGNAEGNGLGSIFARWILPESGFEAWIEWARDDYSLSVADLIAEPDHAQAYTLGFQQVAPRSDGMVRFGGEITHLSNAESRIDDGRPFAVFYTHAGVTQGHTHRGQLLGAFVGPGADAQRLFLDVVGARSVTGAWVERIRWDDDAFARAKSEYGREAHDVEVTFGVRHARGWRGVLLDLSASTGLRRNRGLVNLVGEDPELPWETNLRLELTASWWAGS